MCIQLKKIIYVSNIFLVTDTQLYKRLFPSICWSVGSSVHPLVCELKLKSGTRILGAFYVCVCVGRGLGRMLGVEGDWLPLPIHL